MKKPAGWLWGAMALLVGVSCQSGTDPGVVDAGRDAAGGAGGVVDAGREAAGGVGGSGGVGGCPGGMAYSYPACGPDVQLTCLRGQAGACGGTYCSCDGKKVSGDCVGNVGVKYAWKYYNVDPSDAGTCDPSNSCEFGSGGCSGSGRGGMGGASGPDAPVDSPRSN